MMLVLTACLLATLSALTLGAEILMMPFPYTSHVAEFQHIGEALVKRGHNVHMMLPGHYDGITKFRANTSKIAPFEYEALHRDYMMWTPEEEEEMFKNIFDMTPVEDFRQNWRGFYEIVCFLPSSWCRQVGELSDALSSVRLSAGDSRFLCVGDANLPSIVWGTVPSSPAPAQQSFIQLQPQPQP